eukprot:TRINITY_DN10611_c0_g1_i7.p1 TRINITY_DN10611_c0_g1~~TRINITY_DN10611_c0_g1_i7.p1  ORF type:complete len:372 (-),score=64.29 TRINITY_DN10611_c0_g1_i7:903-2018(-)
MYDDMPDALPSESEFHKKWLMEYEGEMNRRINYNSYRRMEVGDTVLQKLQKMFSSKSVRSWMPEHYRARRGDYLALQRVLTDFCSYSPYGGSRKDFSCFVALVLPIMGTEKRTFKFAAAVHDRFQLEDYYAIQKQEQKLLEKDVLLVLSDMLELFPNAVHIFDEADNRDLLKSWISLFLTSLMACGYNSQLHSVEKYAELLDKMLTYKYATPHDPRKGLRWAVCCVVALNAHFLVHHEKIPTYESSAPPKAPIVLSDELLRVLDEQFDLQCIANVYALHSVPVAAATGCTVGLVGLKLIGGAGMSTSNAVTLGGALVGGLASFYSTWETGKANAALLFQSVHRTIAAQIVEEQAAEAAASEALIESWEVHS